MVIIQKLNCSIDFYNSEDFSWGDVVQGKATGGYKDIVDDKVDIVTGCRFQVYTRYQVSQTPST